jgi:type IV pilus assembly protein PilC
MATRPTTRISTPFDWEGKDRRGTLVTGTSISTSEQNLRAELRRQGIVPSKVRKQKPGFGARKKPNPMDIAIFFRQLATMLGAGIPLVQSLEVLASGHEKPSVQQLILEIKSEIESGSTLKQSLARHPLYFDDLVINLVGAGEQAGALDDLLQKIATYKEKTEALKKKIKKAMFYPAAVLAVAFIVTAILLIFVIWIAQEVLRRLYFAIAFGQVQGLIL